MASRDEQYNSGSKNRAFVLITQLVIEQSGVEENVLIHCLIESWVIQD